jgi:hypothetical protein
MEEITTLQNMCSHWATQTSTQTPLATMMCCLSPDWFIVYTLKTEATGSCEMLAPIYYITWYHFETPERVSQEERTICISRPHKGLLKQYNDYIHQT